MFKSILHEHKLVNSNDKEQSSQTKEKLEVFGLDEWILFRVFKLSQEKFYIIFRKPFFPI